MTIEQVGGSAEGFSPEARRHGSVKEECVDTIVEGSQGTLSFAILLASVRAQEAEVGVVVRERRVRTMLLLNLRPLYVWRAKMGS